jgi:pilus assembly protein FimV
VRVWSKQPIREPVLDFLLEVNWASGRLIRQFTVLLDPPRYEASPAPARRAASVALDRSLLFHRHQRRSVQIRVSTKI